MLILKNKQNKHSRDDPSIFGEFFCSFFGSFVICGYNMVTSSLIFEIQVWLPTCLTVSFLLCRPQVL